LATGHAPDQDVSRRRIFNGIEYVSAKEFIKLL